jgi:hypothetical protein
MTSISSITDGCQSPHHRGMIGSRRQHLPPSDGIRLVPRACKLARTELGIQAINVFPGLVSGPPAGDSVLCAEPWFRNLV